jgi:anti-sigma factor RsiW
MHLTDHLTEVQLNEYLDNAIKDRTNVELHLSSCTDCAARLTALQTLFAEIESLPELVLSRNLAAPVTRRLSGSGAPFFGVPRWLTLTVGLQAALAGIAAVIAAPDVIELASSSSMPVLQAPSLAETLLQLQAQWTAWLDMLSQFHMPTLPELPVVEVSSLFLMFTIAGISMLWLVGNGLLLRNQIK